MEVLRQLQISIGNALEASLDNAYNQLNTELALRDIRVKTAECEVTTANEERIKAAARIDKLEREIVSLRESLSLYELDPKEFEAIEAKSEGIREAYEPERILEICNYNGAGSQQPDLSEIRNIVDTKYRELYSEVRMLIKATGELRSQVKRHKKKLMRWQNLLSRDEFAFVVDGCTTKFQRVQIAGIDKAQPHATVSKSCFVTSWQATMDRDASSVLMLEGELPEASLEVNGQNRMANSRRDHAENGEDPGGPLTAPDRVADADTRSCETAEPSPRPQKRRRALVSHVHPTQSPELQRTQDLPAVRSEALSSSLQESLLCKQLPATQDLDEVGGAVETPTKWRGENFGQGYQSRTSPSPKQTPSTHDNQLINISNKGANVRDRKIERMTCDALSSVAEDGEGDYFEVGPREIQQRRQRHGRSRYIGAEPHRSNTANNQASDRLQVLLEAPTASRPPLTVLGEPPSAEGSPLDHLDGVTYNSYDAIHNISATRRRVTEDLGPWQELMSSSVGAERLKENKLPMQATYDRLYRTLPLGQLNLSHFKINPNFNQGLDFAYDTVVRKREERQCASGCMRRGCCREKFYAMARLGGLPAELERAEGLYPDERDPQDLSDDGDKARAIANKYGKHRHHHHRPRSPPGFWRTDMPNTQDLRRDRDEASEYEREKLMERYKEAMRPGGLWMFADE